MINLDDEILARPNTTRRFGNRLREARSAPMPSAPSGQGNQDLMQNGLNEQATQARNKLAQDAAFGSARPDLVDRQHRGGLDPLGDV